MLLQEEPSLTQTQHRYYTSNVTRLLSASQASDGLQPLYITIAQSIARNIVARKLPDDEPLPSIGELVATYGTTSMTAREAYRHLVSANVIQPTRRGAATRLRSLLAAESYLKSLAREALQRSIRDLLLLGQTAEGIGELARTIAKRNVR